MNTRKARNILKKLQAMRRSVPNMIRHTNWFWSFEDNMNDLAKALEGKAQKLKKGADFYFMEDLIGPLDVHNGVVVICAGCSNHYMIPMDLDTPEWRCPNCSPQEEEPDPETPEDKSTKEGQG